MSTCWSVFSWSEFASPGIWIWGSARSRLTFWHYRDGDREADVVIERPSGEVLGIEVKASATVHPRDFRGLKYMRESIGKRLVAGLVMYAGERTLPFGEGLWAVPLSALWR